MAVRPSDASFHQLRSRGATKAASWSSCRARIDGWMICMILGRGDGPHWEAAHQMIAKARAPAVLVNPGSPRLPPEVRCAF